jgi:hypothetical protein
MYVFLGCNCNPFFCESLSWPKPLEIFTPIGRKRQKMWEKNLCPSVQRFFCCFIPRLCETRQRIVRPSFKSVPQLTSTIVHHSTKIGIINKVTVFYIIIYCLDNKKLINRHKKGSVENDPIGVLPRRPTSTTRPWPHGRDHDPMVDPMVEVRLM